MSNNICNQITLSGSGRKTTPLRSIELRRDKQLTASGRRFMPEYDKPVLPVSALINSARMSVRSGQSLCLKILSMVHCNIHSFLIVLKIKK